MSKLWKSDKRPSNNTVMLELQRLERITVALSIAIAEKRQKHILLQRKEDCFMLHLQEQRITPIFWRR